MEELFITDIFIESLAYTSIQNFDIPLSKETRKHLIITGKNGSGKTTLLNKIMLALNAINQRDTGIKVKMSTLADIPHLPTISGMFLLAIFNSKRQMELRQPTGIQKIDFTVIASGYNNPIGSHFLQHLVNLQAEKSFANEDKDFVAAQKIDEWFIHFERSLGDIFECPELKLIFDRKAYTFQIQEPDKPAYTFTTLPDGYSAIMNILAELLLRIESTGNSILEMQGIVLIDEIETHLHIDLQKKILPFLVGFFPKIQFVVTTHSPFVLSSISNAVVCDLEKKIVTEDLSGYSYDALVESYFSTDKYSSELKKLLNDYETLANNPVINDAEAEQLDILEQYFDNLPKFNAVELEVKLQQIKLKNRLKAAS